LQVVVKQVVFSKLTMTWRKYTIQLAN